MTVTVKSTSEALVIPLSIRRRAGIKVGDHVEFKVSAGSITITTLEPAGYQPTKSELNAIRKGEAELTRGESIDLGTLLHELERPRRKVGGKTTRKSTR